MMKRVLIIFLLEIFSEESSLQSPPKVYFTKNIIPENLIRLYEKLNKPLHGKIAVKIHSGEHDKGYIVQPSFMEPLVKKLNGTIIETNTFYKGNRSSTLNHTKQLEHHGFLPKFHCDIIDGEGEMKIPVKNGKHIKENLIGKNLKNYDSIMVLSHFKGHRMGGFGGAIKNVAIGIASAKGKGLIHGAGNDTSPWNTTQELFLETMAEAAKSVVDYMNGNMVYINVMKDLSTECDCNSDPSPPMMKSIGMLSSIDPVALDQACLDLVYNSKDKGKASLIKRIEEKNGTYTVQIAESIGLGSRKYELIDIDVNPDL